MLRGMFTVEEVGFFGGEGGMEGRELGGFVYVLAFLYGGFVLRLWDSCCFFCSYDLVSYLRASDLPFLLKGFHA